MTECYHTLCKDLTGYMETSSQLTQNTEKNNSIWANLCKEQGVLNLFLLVSYFCFVSNENAEHLFYRANM